jgi:hypothetical protein
MRDRPTLAQRDAMVQSGMVTVAADAAGEWRWTLRGLNGEIVAPSEGYTSESDAWRGLFTALRLATAVYALVVRHEQAQDEAWVVEFLANLADEWE